MPRPQQLCPETVNPRYLHVNWGCWDFPRLSHHFLACNWQPWQPMLWMISTIWDNAKLKWLLGLAARTIVKRWYVPFRFPQKPQHGSQKKCRSWVSTLPPRWHGSDGLGWQTPSRGCNEGEQEGSPASATKKQTDVDTWYLFLRIPGYCAEFSLGKFLQKIHFDVACVVTPLMSSHMWVDVYIHPTCFMSLEFSGIHLDFFAVFVLNGTPLQA